MARITFSSLRAHKRRLFGMFASVLLGVAFLAGTLVLGDTLQGSFDKLFANANEGTDVVVQREQAIESDYASEVGVIDGSIAQQIAQIDGVAAAEPFVQGYGRIIGADGDGLGGNGPPTFAAGWLDNTDLNPYRIVEGRAPQADGEVVINRGAAKDGKLQVGDRTVVQVPEPVDVTIVGIATFGDEDGVGPTTIAFFTPEAAARHITHDPNTVTQVLVHGDGSVSQDELAARIEPLLPDGVEAITGTAQTAEQLDTIGDDFLDAFKIFLVVFAAIALLVASFSIHNTFAILVAQRTRASALLRAVGASRRQILTWTTAEALLLGALASGIGLAAGIGLAVGLKALLDSFGFAFPSGGLVFEPSTAVIALLAGVGVTMIAALGPAVKASRVAPLAALRDINVDRTNASLLRAITGALLLAGGIVLVSVAVAAEADISVAGLGALATILGVSVFGPVIARPVSRALGAVPAKLRGITGRLARNNAMRNPRRTAGTATALMVGVGVVTLFTVFAASMKQSVNDAVAGSVRGDLVISAGQWGGGGMTTDLAEDVRELPEVSGAAGIGLGAALVDGDSEYVTVLDPGAAAEVLDLDVTDGSLGDLAADQIAVSSRTADDEDWTLGSPVELGFADGTTTTATVGAIYDARDIVMPYVMPRAMWNQHVAQAFDATVVVALNDGVSLDTGRAAVQRVADEYRAPDVQDKEEYIDTAAGNIDQVLGLIYVMLFLAIVIALMGIANTLSLAVYERTSELGILRAVGTTRAQLRATVRWESVIVAIFGTLAGIGVGVFLGWGLVRVAGASGVFDGFAIPVSQLAVIVVVGAIAGVLAAVRPARRAARLDVLNAIKVS